MNIDLTPEELAQLVKLCEASGTMSENVTAALHLKAMRCLQNFKPPGASELVDAREMAHKWRSPI